MSDLLHWLVDYYDEVYIIIDGIDEVDDEEERLFLISSLQKLALAPARVLITYRSEYVVYKDIKRDPEGKEGASAEKFYMEISRKDVGADIERHLEWVFKNDPKLSRIKHRFKDDLKHAIDHHHDGK